MSDDIKTEPGDPAPWDEAEEDMHIHKPKAAHGVREFVTEIGIIVVGILVALSAEQVVEQLRWRERVHEVREQLLAENSSNAGAALFLLTVSPCLDQQLAETDQQVWQGRRSGSIQPPQHRFSPELVHFSDDSWLSARSMQVSDHMDRQEVIDFTRVYFFASEQIGSVTRMHELAGELEPLTRPLEQVSPAEADDLLSKIGRIKELQSRMELASTLVIKGADEVHAPSPLARVQAELPALRKHYGSCIADPAVTLKAALNTRLDEQETRRLMRLAKPDF
jgi:hypothetical protein